MRISLLNRPRWQDRKGQALVEFALVVPLLLLFLLGIIQMGLLFNGFITIQQAARIGVREASLGESTKSVGCAIHTQIATDGIFPATAVVSWSVTPSPDGVSPSTVNVAVSTNYPLLIGIPGFGQQVPIAQNYTMVQEDPSGGAQSTTSAYSCS